MRKLCTRQHFIEYLSYNFVEKQCLMARCTWQRYFPDLGKDGFVISYTDRGEPEDGKIEVQVKATDHIERFRLKDSFYFDINRRDLESWLSVTYQQNPFLLVLYDAKADIAYFLEIASYFKSGNARIEKINKFVRVYIPCDSVLNPASVKLLRWEKNELL